MSGVVIDGIDLTKMRRDLPFTRRASGTSKIDAPCPRCGSMAYGYHGGRFKQCPRCGFHRFGERLVSHVQYEARRGRPILEITGQMAVEYYRRVYLSEPGDRNTQPTGGDR